METTRVNLQDYKKWVTPKIWATFVGAKMCGVRHRSDIDIDQRSALRVADNLSGSLLLIWANFPQLTYFPLLAGSSQTQETEFICSTSLVLKCMYFKKFFVSSLWRSSPTYQFFFVDTIWRGWHQIVLSKCIQGCPPFCHIFSPAVAVVLDYRYRIAAKFSKPLSTIQQAEPWYWGVKFRGQYENCCKG